MYKTYFCLQTWLINYELPDTLMILAEDNIHFLASKKKIDFLRKLEDAKPEETNVPAVKLHVRDRVSYFLFLKSTNINSYDLILIINFG